MYSSSGGSSSSSSENEQEQDISGRGAQVGVLIGNSSSLELSAVAGIQRSSSEGRPTKSIANGTVDPLTEPPVWFDKALSKSAFVDFRHQLTDRLLLGGRIGLFATTVESSSKNRYFDAGRPGPVYEERKTQQNEASSYQVAAALTYQIPTVGLAGVEYSFRPISSKDKFFYTTKGTAPGNRPYNAGDVDREYTEEGIENSLTLGAELFLTESIIARAGGKVVWATLEQKQSSHYYQESSEQTGRRGATHYLSGGLTYDVGFLRIDYALGSVPRLFYSSYFGSVPWNPFSFDVWFQHHLTVTFTF